MHKSNAWTEKVSYELLRTAHRKFYSKMFTSKPATVWQNFQLKKLRMDI